ncbi:N-acetylglucosamine-6-sulfatase-like [Halichondria panicea]|uniref:N-acetylglucosamine-6-sulfatase-like n=1 Tax=Halichondria panicea TaxID=6063 RepID=UPI00312B8F39
MQYAVWLFMLLLNLSECKPNIVYILTDDQDIKLGGVSNQTYVNDLLASEGLSFTNAFVTTPVCCPSRSSILTGKYVHNHYTYENSVDAGCNAPTWRSLNENSTIGTYLQKAGYKTGFFGKYLNNYGLPASGVGPEHIPPGWSTWFGLIGNSKYYDYSVSNNGVLEKHGHSYEKDYFTDLVRNHSVQFIKASTDSPFFAYIATPAPHRDAEPAPQYANVFKGKVAPRTASYGQHGKNKHWIISEGTPSLTSNGAQLIDNLYQDRKETLLSVDDLVKEVVSTLESEGILDNTFIFYNSDHGYHLGQFNQRGEKRQVYDENIRVPLIVRGPGIAPNTVTEALALNIDMAPTFIDFAGLPIPDSMDGVSLKETLEGGKIEDSYNFAVEYFGEGSPFGHDVFYTGPNIPFIHDCTNNTWYAIRSFSTIGSAKKYDTTLSHYYIKDSLLPPDERDDLYFTEMYDLTEDPWQLNNLKNGDLSQDLTMMLSKMNTHLNKLAKCSGRDCRELRVTEL